MCNAHLKSKSWSFENLKSYEKPTTFFLYHVIFVFIFCSFECFEMSTIQNLSTVAACATFACHIRAKLLQFHFDVASALDRGNLGNPK